MERIKASMKPLCLFPKISSMYSCSASSVMLLVKLLVRLIKWLVVRLVRWLAVKLVKWWVEERVEGFRA